jgi:eukaryotic translation initiation factor 2C
VSWHDIPISITQLTPSHYDVDINPVVAVQNQKKPKAMLRAVWEQLCAEAKGQWAPSFATCAYDGRKNCFTPVPFPLQPGQLLPGPVPKRELTRAGEVHVFTTAISPDQKVHKTKDESSSDDEWRRFKVAIKHVAEIDLEKVMEFCRSDKHTPSGEEECLTGELPQTR